MDVYPHSAGRVILIERVGVPYADILRRSPVPLFYTKVFTTSLLGVRTTPETVRVCGDSDEKGRIEVERQKPSISVNLPGLPLFNVDTSRASAPQSCRQTRSRSWE